MSDDVIPIREVVVHPVESSLVDVDLYEPRVGRETQLHCGTTKTCCHWLHTISTYTAGLINLFAIRPSNRLFNSNEET